MNQIKYKKERKKERKKKKERTTSHQMLSSDIRVPAEEADKAFIRAWNLLVGHRLRYIASFNELARDGENELGRYRAREMVRLLGERGRLKEFDYGLCNQVLEYIEVTEYGKLAVIFPTGTRVTV